MPRADPELAAPLVPESTDGFNHRESAVTPSSSAAGVRQSRGCRLAAVGAIGLGLIAMVGVGLSGHKSTSADSPSAPPSPPEHRAVNETALVLSYKEWKDLNRADFSMHSAQEHEEDKRAEIFAHNKALIDAHNEKYAAGEASYLMATGPFADLSPEEFIERHLTGFTLDGMGELLSDVPELRLPLRADRAASVDWVAEGKITAVKDQGQCGSCWAFATTGVVEGACAVAGHELTSLSEQQLVDCDGYDSGCQGGRPDWSVFKYIMDNGGFLDSEEDYPYSSGGGGGGGDHQCDDHSDCPVGNYCDASNNCFDCGYISEHTCDALDGDCCSAIFLHNCPADPRHCHGVDPPPPPPPADATMCNPYSVPAQLCPDGSECRECGNGNSCPCGGNHPQTDTLRYNGYEYRTLMDTTPARTAEVCHTSTNPLPIPSGYELAPDTADIRTNVVAAHPWSTDVMVLDSLKGYGTASFRPGEEFGDAQPKAVRTGSGMWFCPWSCCEFASTFQAIMLPLLVVYGLILTTVCL